MIKDMKLNPHDFLIRFYVISLFTRVPVKESIKLLDTLVTNTGLANDIPRLAEYCLKNTYLLWKGDFHQQKEKAAMGSHLSPVIANLYMEYF